MESEPDYVVVWRIENLSHWCEEVHGDCIKSPQFHIRYLTHLELFQQVFHGKGHLTVRFCDIKCSFSGDLSIYSSDGSLLSKLQFSFSKDSFQKKKRKTFSKKEIPPAPKFEDVLSKIREGEDFITVRCRITDQHCYEQRMFTTINVFKLSLKMNPRWIETVKFDKTNPVYCILRSQNDDLQRMRLNTCSKNDKVHFTIEPPEEYEYPFAVEMSVTLTGSDGTVDRCVKKERVFRDNSPWTFLESLEKKELVGKEISLFLCLKTKNLIQYDYFTNFDCSNASIELNNTPNFFEKAPSTGSVTSNKVAAFEKDNDMPEDSVTVLTKELMCVYQDQKFSDINLKCDNVTFPVHKVILSARSPVLDRLLSSDMKEAASGEVEIGELDPSTLGLFLTYLYTGAVEEELQCDRALKLYYAADKYQVPSLKRDCSKFLCANLSVSNVCDILSLADRHHDDELTAASLDFILDNYNDVLKSEEWDTLKKNEPLLVAETLTQFAVEDRVAKKHQPE